MFGPNLLKPITSLPHFFLQFSNPSSVSSHSMALSIARPRHGSYTNPTMVRLFSTSSSPSANPPGDQSNAENDTDSQSRTSKTSGFYDIQASLKQRENPQYQNQKNKQIVPPSWTTFTPSLSNSNSKSEASSLDEIKKKLARYSLRLPGSQNDAGQRQQAVSLHESYKRSMPSWETNGTTPSTESAKRHGDIAIGSIAERVRKFRLDTEKNNDGGRKVAASFSGFRSSGNVNPTNASFLRMNSLRPKPTNVPSPVLDTETGTEFLRWYDYEELGEKLSSLRSEVKGDFSLSELNERVRKLCEMEEIELEQANRLPFAEMRESIISLGKEKEEKSDLKSKQILHASALSGLTPEYTKLPPQEHLLEKYFHPDNMSSAEKMKIELAKVREEFKMSESDCGSARVQVAQLTTKIKHLSSVLHKKDKHSRKGLQEMVQKRKKLLKYLRRTDWDSYCFVLSKLGLRDDPHLKSY